MRDLPRVVFGVRIASAAASPSWLSIPGGAAPSTPPLCHPRIPPNPDTPLPAGRMGSPGCPPAAPRPPVGPGGGWYSSLRPDRNVLCVRSGPRPGRQSWTLFIHPAPASLHPAGLDLRWDWGSPAPCLSPPPPPHLQPGGGPGILPHFPPCGGVGNNLGKYLCPFSRFPVSGRNRRGGDGDSGTDPAQQSLRLIA